MAELAPNQASIFSIREVTGRGRQIALSQRALPYRPFTLSGTQRAEFTWYPGNPVATVQVLGTAEEETTIHGMWKDRFLSDFEAFGFNASIVQAPPASVTEGEGSERQLSTARELAAEIDSIRRQGQLVDVQWDNVGRRGIITRFVQTWHVPQDLEWEITFTWIAQAGDEDVPAVFHNETDMASIAQSWAAQLNQLIAKAQAPFALFAEYSAAVIQGVDALENAIDLVGDAVATVSDSVLAPLDATSRLASIMESIKGGAEGVIANIDASPHLTHRQDSGVSLNPQGTPSEVSVGLRVDAAKFDRDLERTARSIQRQAARQQFDLGTRLQPDLLAVFVARENMDLRAVSTKFYKTPDEWKQLEAFNGLKTSKLNAGQTVFVPQLKVQV